MSTDFFVGQGNGTQLIGISDGSGSSSWLKMDTLRFGLHLRAGTVNIGRGTGGPVVECVSLYIFYIACASSAIVSGPTLVGVLYHIC